jgi:hypothetical protein
MPDLTTGLLLRSFERLEVRNERVGLVELGKPECLGVGDSVRLPDPPGPPKDELPGERVGIGKVILV